MDSFVFSGAGFAHPPHLVTTEHIARLASAGLFKGYPASAAKDPSALDAYHAAHPHLTRDEAALCDSVQGHGFERRYHIAPYPTAARWRHPGVDAAELAARAIDEALGEAGLAASDIGAWVVSSCSTQGAPGIAALVREYFAVGNDLSQVRSLNGGCGAFMLALQTAREMLQTQPGLQHVVVAHTEVMSAFVGQQDDYLRPALFGDGAAAVVLSRAPASQDAGLVAVKCVQQQAFMGNIGIDCDNTLYHDPGAVKKLAVEGMVVVGQALLAQAGLSADQIDWFLPHQTGNGIVDKTARMLGIDPARVIKDVQRDFGNISGATVPAAWWALTRGYPVKPGQWVLATAAGVSGELGGFLYRVPHQAAPAQASHPLKGTRVLLTGATGGIGREVLAQLRSAGAEVTVVLRKPAGLAPDVAQEVSDLSVPADIDALLERLESKGQPFDHLIVCSGVPGPVQPALTTPAATLQEVLQVNYLGPAALVRGLARRRLLKGALVLLGSASEDFQTAGSASYVAAKRAMHGWAASASGELQRMGVRCVYVQYPVVNTGMTTVLSDKQRDAACALFGQAAPIEVGQAAAVLLRGLWANRVAGTFDSAENAMTVRRVGHCFRDARPDR